MSKTRRKFSPEFKFKVVLEALKERETLAQLAVRFEVHQTMISNWKKEFVKNPEKFFEKDHSGKSFENTDANSLYTKIGQLEMENDLRKKACEKSAFEGQKRVGRTESSVEYTQAMQTAVNQFKLNVLQVCW